MDNGVDIVVVKPYGAEEFVVAKKVVLNVNDYKANVTIENPYINEELLKKLAGLK